MTVETVIKVGGSVGRGDGLAELARTVAELARQHSLLIVPGGGDFADTVRAYDRRFRLSDSTAHWMAVLAMDQYGWLLADCIPGSVAVRTLSEAQTVAHNGQTPVLLPFDLLRQADPLPHSWAVTSDSIAAWVAVQVGAARLVLLKDVDGLYPAGSPPAETPPPETISLSQLAGCGGVDSYLAGFLKTNPLPVWAINGAKPERLAELLTTGRTLGTRYQPAGP